MVSNTTPVSFKAAWGGWNSSRKLWNPCLPKSEVSKLVANVLPASVNPLEQEFDDDAGEQLDLRRDKDVREVITCEVEPSLLADLEVIGGKGAEKVTKNEDNQKYVIFNHYSNFSNDNLLHNSQFLIIRSHYINR